jgi:hypothetical protein
MQRHHTLALVAASLLPLCGTTYAQCSTAMVRGSWGYQIRGTAMMTLPGSSDPAPVPLAGVGIAKIDWQGRYTIHATISAGGYIQEVDFSGSVQVNPDCTATDAYTSGTAQGVDRLVILDNGNEMRSMPTKFPLGPVAATAVFRRISWAEAQCTSNMVRGVYGGSREGTVLMPMPGQTQLVPAPFSAVHTATLGAGGIGTAASVASMGGTVIEFQMPKISVQVNPDCTANMSYTATSNMFPGMTFTGAIKYVVLNYGSELIGVETEGNSGLSIVLESLKRISMQ